MGVNRVTETKVSFRNMGQREKLVQVEHTHVGLGRTHILSVSWASVRL